MKTICVETMRNGWTPFVVETENADHHYLFISVSPEAGFDTYRISGKINEFSAHLDGDYWVFECDKGHRYFCHVDVIDNISEDNLDVLNDISSMFEDAQAIYLYYEHN